MDLDKYLPNAAMKAEFEKFKTLKTKEEKDAFAQERKANYENMTEEDKAAYRLAAEEGIASTAKACNDFISRAEEEVLREKLGELPEAISLSYVAKKYFGKSRSWIYQRINGYSVNGKQAQFTQEELDTFKFALNDIGSLLNRTSLAIG